jgi:ATP adenylyltransferase
LLRKVRLDILNADSSVKGFNVGANVGLVSGQTIFHCHIHLIPRRNGDVPDPLGGVRAVIPEKMRY